MSMGAVDSRGDRPGLGAPFCDDAKSGWILDHIAGVPKVVKTVANRLS